MSFHIPFENSYARLPDRFFSRMLPVPVKAPTLLAFNHGLAKELGIKPGPDDVMAQVFGGNTPPEGAEPLAQVYAGHQFGGFSPQLGDGRAHLLGEIVTPAGARVDLQLKGSGPTPYSRMGDGRAWLGPVLREYVVSEAMHALGIPTSRALAAVATGESVYRDTGAMPGAVLTRVATSHLRVGTFQYFAARRDMPGLKALFDYAVQRHAPEAETPADLLETVIDRQAQLVAQWMSVGFIHGVMNTDNTSISGETIDYGPCAFMDGFHPDTVFSSIDAQGRYAFSNQPNVIVWNMAQLATALVGLMPDQDAAVSEFTQLVHAMPDRIHAYWLAAYGRKIGIAQATPEDETLITDLLQAMAENDADFTNTFRALVDGTPRDHFTDPAAFDRWAPSWQDRIKSEVAPFETMRAANPAYIPRNHQVEQMIQAAVAGDFRPFDRLMRVLSDPFTRQDGADDLTRPPGPSEVVHRTFCGT